MVIHAISLYICVKHGLTLPWHMTIFYFSTTSECLLIILIIFGSFAKVIHESKHLHRNLKGDTQLQKNRWFKRFWRSCQIIKIYLGRTNYFEDVTPLKIEDFVIQQTVNLMLMK